MAEEDAKDDATDRDADVVHDGAQCEVDDLREHTERQEEQADKHGGKHVYHAPRLEVRLPIFLLATEHCRVQARV
eukprot:CAMPEP_0179052740 /NCGR_PEP_ID=MMETSP0796-20121207/21912_1 /TAXON_ID=73915 /ORGANISM="Pyrodinium bahamense, Strain pbaha01" /LENGTH=74 /DNA_ID=CAMNT_0020749313 /DNA_START=404 /DNA_END=628 /DNA_ORIENTATION=-